MNQPNIIVPSQRIVIPDKKVMSLNESNLKFILGARDRNTVFNKKQVDHLTQPMFFGEARNVARFDVVQYQDINQSADDQHQAFWRPVQVPLTIDKLQFNQNLTDDLRFIATKNLSYQIVMDSVNGRSPLIGLLPYISIPELEQAVIAWGFFESIHSASYTYILREVYASPDEVFNSIMTDESLIARAGTMTKYYDEFIEYAKYYSLFGFGRVTIEKDGEAISLEISEYELNVKLYKALISVYILESVRFFASFMCTFAFAQQKLLEGIATEIQLIARDEIKHIALVLMIFDKFKTGNYPVMQQVMEDLKPFVIQLFKEAVEEEKEWGAYTLGNKNLFGFTQQTWSDYSEYIANIRLYALGFNPIYDIMSDPCAFGRRWLESSSVQKPPQDTTLANYLTGAVASSFDTAKLARRSL